jgi:molecular chaperone DnaK
MPQIEVAFDIDANGILHVSAKDKASNKEQRIVIKASGGLSEDDIKRMVKDAEAHADEDKKFRELVDTRNRADALVHSSDKALKDLGEKVSPTDRQAIESAIADLKTALAGDDKDVIETKAKALSEASASLAQQAYAQSEQAAGAGATADAGSQGGGASGNAGGKDDVLDAEFEEVKDRKKGA